MSTVDELEQEIASLSAHLDAATHRLLECIRQFDESGNWFEQGAISCAHWLAWRVGLDPATAREKVRVARALAKLPTIDGALRVGKLSYAKVRALTRVATPANEAQLLDLALYATGAQLERMCRGYRTALSADETPSPEERSVRQRLLPGGMVRLEMTLLPDEADLVLRAIDRAREVHHESKASESNTSAETAKCDGKHANASAESTWPSRPDGAVALAESFLAGHSTTGNGGERFQVMLHLEQEVLGSDGAFSATLDDGTRVSPETLRRVACDCGLVVASQGEELNIGRRARTIPPAIRRALMLRDRGCCFPGCTHMRFLHGHHIQHWLHGGETSVQNLAILCTAHHHLVHEGGWSVERTAEGELKFTSPTGKLLPPSPTRGSLDDTLTWLHEWAADRGLDLGPDANMPLWDGTRADYDSAVLAMLAG